MLKIITGRFILLLSGLKKLMRCLSPMYNEDTQSNRNTNCVLCFSGSTLEKSEISLDEDIRIGRVKIPRRFALRDVTERRNKHGINHKKRWMST
jgi:hypothetical protein